MPANQNGPTLQDRTAVFPRPADYIIELGLIAFCTAALEPGKVVKVNAEGDGLLHGLPVFEMPPRKIGIRKLRHFCRVYLAVRNGMCFTLRYKFL